jgi:hypothetical protein
MANESVGTIKSKIAIITGGSRGLGRNTAVNLARRSVKRPSPSSAKSKR